MRAATQCTVSDSPAAPPDPAELAQDRVLILDFGSQVTQLIARRLRESGVYCEIWPFNAAPARIAAFAPRAIILSGGPASVPEGDSPRAPQCVFEAGVPVLGICYGQMTMCAQLGGEVEQSDHREFGRAFVEVREPCALFQGVWSPGAREQVWMSHGDRVLRLPPGFRVVGVSEGAPFAAFADDSRRFYGVMFHPEVMHTPHGAQLLRNFSHVVAGCRGDWTMGSFRETEIARIRSIVGSGRVICGLSGGVDSSVAAVLIHEAIGDQLTCIFVDHGLLRRGEAEEVVSTFRDRFNIRLVHRDAAVFFLRGLDGVTDPEAKRKTIGRLFIEVFEEEAAKIGGADFLAQGTLYPDVIESVSFTGGPSVTIKSHHNVGGLPERMRMRLIEPLRELFKDEVRRLGVELGLPREMVYRHPFPGPGLGVRILGAVRKEFADLLRRADAIFIDELRKHDFYDRTSQAFAVFLPVRSVGVMGDGRRYDYVVALRAVETVDFMTAHWARLPYDFLDHVSRRIVNEVSGISRVVYDISGKPPATIEWE
jgi:GMP synthase (glutamine-hydrolysing)